jgi:ABC-type lipoprotein export system ATPase subunit
MSLDGTLNSLVLEILQPDKSILPIVDIPHIDFVSGELIGLSGPSGSGKTSLIHCLAGLVIPNKGDVIWGETNITKLNGEECDKWRRQHVGLIFQDFQLIPELFVLENIILPQFFSQWKLSFQDRMNAINKANNLGLHNVEQRVSSLSRGEQQRVAVVRALWQCPSLILADEPTASLDRENSDKVIQALIAHARSHQAILIVASHDQEVLGLMERIISLANGQLQT